MNNASLIRTERLNLRLMQSTDWPFFLQIHQEPALMRFVAPDLTAEQIRQRFDSRLLGWPQSEFTALPMVISSQQTGELLGLIGLKAVESEPQAAELGYILALAAQGQGVASEAVAALIAFARSQGFCALYALVVDGHSSSVRLLQRQGFELAERRPGVFSAQGQLLDDLWFRLSF